MAICTKCGEYIEAMAGEDAPCLCFNCMLKSKNREVRRRIAEEIINSSGY
jgi:hypothetical protein